MSGEQIVTIKGPRGRLFGIVHRPPAASRADSCLIMLNSGQISRVGPQRLYVKAARRWAALGITVLRVDLSGIGDSEAENAEIHFDNQSTAEIAAVVRYARQVLGARRVVLQGLCAGARAAFKCAAEDSSIDAVLSWSCPIFNAADGMPVSPEESAGRMSSSRGRESIARIGEAIGSFRILTLRWWRNRLRYGWSELVEMARIFAHFLRRPEPVVGRFLAATDRYLAAGRKTLFVYGSRDRVSLAEFGDRFESLPEGLDYDQGYTVIEGGTHTFSSADAQSEVIARSQAWLKAVLDIG